MAGSFPYADQQKSGRSAGREQHGSCWSLALVRQGGLAGACSITKSN